MKMKRGKLTRLDNQAIRAAYPFECEEAKALRRAVREQNAIERDENAKKPKAKKDANSVAAGKE